MMFSLEKKTEIRVEIFAKCDQCSANLHIREGLNYLGSKKIMLRIEPHACKNDNNGDE